MANTLFKGTVSFEVFADGEGIHPDLGVSWHCIGTAHIASYYEDGEYWNDITVQSFFMCADTNDHSTPSQFTEVDYNNSDFQRTQKKLIDEIEIKIAENAGKYDDCMVSEFANAVLAYWSEQRNKHTAQIMVTVHEMIEVKTEAA